MTVLPAELTVLKMTLAVAKIIFSCVFTSVLFELPREG